MFDVLDFAGAAVQIAMDGGASEAEAALSIADRFSCEARDRTVTKVEQSTGRSLHMRVFADGRKASFATTDFTRENLELSIRRAVAQAHHVARDRFATLPENCGADSPSQDLQLFWRGVAERAPHEKIEEALAMEVEIRRADARVKNSSGSHASDSTSTIALANSRGFAGTYRATRIHRSTNPVALDGEMKRTASYGTAARRLEDLESAASVALNAARRSTALFGARKPQTMRVPVIFERDVAASLLADVFAAVNAANVAVGNSWLAERAGTQVGSELFSVVDDGTMPAKLGSSPFDGEGVATRRTVVFERGRLQTFLYDTYYARKLDAASTGNSSGGGIGPNNFYLEPGSGTLHDLIGATARGVLVLDTIGFATEHASGTYSRGARGFYIENGEIAYPIEEFTVAAPFRQILAGVDAVAADLRYDGSVVSPSFRVAEMTVSGD